MTRPGRAALLLLFTFGLLPSCKESAPTEKGTPPEEAPAGKAETTGKVDGGDSTPAPDPAAPDQEAAPAAPPTPPSTDSFVPVAIDLGRTRHYLAAGVLFRADHPATEDKVCVGFLIPEGSRIGTTRVWLGEEEGWQSTSRLPTAVPGLVVTTLRREPKQPVFDLAQAPPLPATIDHLLVPAWGAALTEVSEEEKAATREEETKAREAEELRKDFQARYDALADEMEELRQPIPRNEIPRDPGARRQLEAERRQRSVELSRTMSELRSEASRAGVRISSTSRYRSSSRRSSLGTPERSARLEKKAIEASLESAGDTLFSPLTGEDLPVNGLVPGLLLARETEAGHEVLGLRTLAELCEPGTGTVSAHLRLSRADRGELVTRVDLAPAAFGYSAIRLGVAPAGTLPDDLSKAPFHSTGSFGAGRAWMEAELRLPFDEMSPGEMEVAVELRHSSNGDWQPLDTLRFELRAGPENSVLPVLGEPPERWQAPPPPEQKTALPAARFSKTLTVTGAAGTVLAGGGAYLVVQVARPNRLRLLDLETEEWRGELTLPEDSSGLSFAADQERLFVADPVNGTLRAFSLPALEELATRKFPAGPAPVAVAAGYASANMPVAFLHGDRLTLCDPSTLVEIDEPVRPVHSDRSVRCGLATLEWTSPGPHQSRRLRASPVGDQFLLEVTTAISERQGSHTYRFNLNRMDARWDLTAGYEGIPGPNSLLYNHSYPRAGKQWFQEEAKKRPAIPNITQLLPVAGSGHGLVARLSRYRTLPPTPLGIYVVNNMDDEVPVLAARAGGLAESALVGTALSNQLADHLHILPRLGKIVAWAGDQLTIEHFATAEGDPAPSGPALLPVANRGEEWRYPTAGRLHKGPDGATASDGVITWAVPADYSLPYARFEVELEGVPDATVLYTPVYGVPAARVRVAGSEQSIAAPTVGTLSFPGGIDRLLSSPSGRLAAVVTGGHRRVTIVDLAKLEAVSSYESSTGLATFGLGHRSLYVWHLDGNLLETRSLPDLAANRIRPLDTSARLRALVVGTTPNALPPLALLAGENRRLEGRTIDPETLALSTPLTLPPNFHGSSRPTPTLQPSTPNGSTFVLDNILARRGVNGEVTLLKHPNNYSESSHFTADGATFLRGGQALELDTGRSWSVNLGKLAWSGSRENNILWPDLDQDYVLAVTHFRNQEGRSHVRILILDAKTQETRFEIEQFHEWDGVAEELFRKIADSRLLFASASGALLTTSADGTQLVLRRVPLK